MHCGLHQLMRALCCRCYVFGAEERAALVHKASSYCAKLLRRTDQCQAVLAASHLYWQPEAEGKQAVQDEQGVLSCLKRALKVANAAQQQLAVAGRPSPARGGEPGGGPAAASSLFVEILNHYLLFFDRGCQLITPPVLQVCLWVGGRGRMFASDVAAAELSLTPARCDPLTPAWCWLRCCSLPQSLLELVANEMATDAARDSEAVQAFYERTLDHIRQKKAAGGDAAAKYDALQV
jgi:vacuolar protein sorting-associated protein 35